MTQADINKAHSEIRRIRSELKAIEKTLENLAQSPLPQEKADPQEIKELKTLQRESEAGEHVNLEETLKKHGAKKRA